MQYTDKLNEAFSSKLCMKFQLEQALFVLFSLLLSLSLSCFSFLIGYKSCQSSSEISAKFVAIVLALLVSAV